MSYLNFTNMLRTPHKTLLRRHCALFNLKSNRYTTEKNFPSHADVVIIGGGSIGCNTFYQLSKRDVQTVLLERAKVTSGTTWHTAGLLWRLRTNDIEIQLLNGTRKLLTSIESETGINPGWINNGSIFIARNEHRLDAYKRLHTIGHYFGVESHIISPSEAKKLFPILESKAFIAALHSPGDGVMDPSMLCSALIKGATSNGGQLVEDCPVTKILTSTTSGTKKIIGVETPMGVVKTNCVVNATGVWARNIAQMVELDLPMVGIKHAYSVTDSIPEIKGAPNVRDHDVYFRVQGNSLLIGGYESAAEILKEVPEDFQFGLYDGNLDIFGVHLQFGSEICPKLENVGIKKVICGPETFTPDHKPILGEDPRLGGLYHACAFNSHGMMLGAGCAEQLAIWITKGRPDLPMFDYDIRRYTPAMRTDRPWIIETCHESYANYTGNSFPHSQPLAGRNFKIDPFHSALVANGAVMEQSQGWERPGFFIKDDTAPVRGYDWYGNYDHVKNEDRRYQKQLEGDNTFGFSKHHDLIGEEAMAARTNLALFNLSYYCKMYLTGPDAQEAADWLFTANTDENVEKVIYSCALNSRGGVEADLTVTPLNQGVGTLVGPILKGKGYYLVSNGFSGYHTISHLRKEIDKKKLKATITDVTDKMGILSIQGPKSGELLQSITESPITNEKIPLGMSDLITINGHICRAMRYSTIGEFGFELHIPAASCIPVFNLLTDAGRSFDLRHAGFRALDSLNCEKGYHLWNHDLRSDDNPIEANLDRMCRQQGTYLGKEKIDKIRKEGTKKIRAFFTLEEKIPLYGLETIWRDDAVVGYLRRGEYGYALDCSIGIGYIMHPEGKVLEKDFLISGKYELEVMGKRYPTKFYLKSPFDAASDRKRGRYGQQEEELTNFDD